MKTKNANASLMKIEIDENGHEIPRDAYPYLQVPNKHYMYIDGTFDMIERGLSLTTVLYDIDGISTPVAWIIHSNKSEEDYSLALETLRRKTKHLMRPLAIFLDFEAALKNALAKVFPGVPIYGGFFHFMQANVRWLQQHKYPQHITVAVETLSCVPSNPVEISLVRTLCEFIFYFNAKILCKALFGMFQ
jgi:hypothetical protein